MSDQMRVRQAVEVIMGTVVGLTFMFGFGNVLSLGLRLGVPGWGAPLVAPAVDLSVMGLLQPFARLLNTVSRAGLAMTCNKKYRRSRYMSERQFHDDLHAALLADPTLEGRVERGTALAHGYLGTRHHR